MIIQGSLGLCFWKPKMKLLMFFANLPKLFKMRKALILFQLEVIMEVNFKWVFWRKWNSPQFFHPKNTSTKWCCGEENRFLEERARTLLNETKQPKYFRADVVSIICYTLNRVLIRPILKKTPYELYKGRKTNISHLRVFGCKCFVLNNDKEFVNRLASETNLQVVKTWKSECQFPQELCFTLVLYNFQFIRGKYEV